MPANKYTITAQMVFSLMLIGIFILVVGTLFHLWFTLNHDKHSLIRESTLEAELMADMTTAPLAFFDIKSINEQLVHLSNNKTIITATVYTTQKVPLASFSPQHHPLSSVLPPLGSYYKRSSWFPWILGNLTTTIEIKEHRKLLGYLTIEKSTDHITALLYSMLTTLLIFSAILLSIVYITARALSKKILAPVLLLAQTAQKIADTSDYTIRVSHAENNEIASLYHSFNHMLSETQSLTTQLEERVASRTKALEESFESLQKTQLQMVQSEKMAALGSLVSGVAHEVNTPLGNAITGGSIILKESKQLLQQMEEGTLKKSSMEQGLKVLSETAHLMVRSLNQAADLIRSFKRISVDQSVEEIQEFNFYEYIEEILLTFHNKLKKIPVTVSLSGDHKLTVKSYPGAFAQIITNFIQNSLLHGFDGTTSDATIAIHFEIQGDHLVVTYADNGAGMDDTIKKIAFEPFTTTKRNTGGSGLGLNIIYNLITQKLNGTITLKSEPAKGTTFTITLPLKLPDAIQPTNKKDS